MTRSLIILMLASCSFPDPHPNRVDGGAIGTNGSDDAPGDAVASGDMVTLTVTRVGSGTVQSEPPGIACDPDCTASFPAGTSITLMATSAQGSQFGSWTGCSGSPSCTFV